MVSPPGAVPGPLPDGLMLVGDPYDVTLSGTVAQLEANAVVAMHYDQSLLTENSSPESIGLYRWRGNEGKWHKLDSNLDEVHQVRSATVSALGTYALLLPSEDDSPMKACDFWRTYFPLVLNE